MYFNDAITNSKNLRRGFESSQPKANDFEELILPIASVEKHNIADEQTISSLSRRKREVLFCLTF